MLNLSKPLYSEQIVIDQSDDWEELVSEGMNAREQKDQSQWKLGELADRVNTRYGTDAVGLFAVNIGVNKKSLLRYRDVYRRYKGKEINPAVSFSHHMKAATTEDPEKWLNEAYENSWSVEKMAVEIDKNSGKSESSRKCKNCGKYVK